MRIQFVCLLLALLCAALLSQPAHANPRYLKFINQHVNGRMSVTSCDAVIRSRQIKTGSNKCKQTNTFILANIKTINAICRRAGEPYGRLTKSFKPFPIVVCTLTNQGARYPNCQYRGQARTRTIGIVCDHGYPVHFETDIVHFEN